MVPSCENEYFGHRWPGLLLCSLDEVYHREQIWKNIFGLMGMAESVYVSCYMNGHLIMDSRTFVVESALELGLKG